MKTEEIKKIAEAWSTCDCREDIINMAEWILKAIQVVEAARNAEKICDDFYKIVELEARIYSICSDDCDIWFARDNLHLALKDLEK